MKPVFLRMQAFGPYAREQNIDFATLGDKNFFLITGPTGAGKTTILDAMTFALYGTGSGNLRDGKSMRSDYAPAEYPTQVDFTFALGMRKFIVSRSPEQEIKKKRGEGNRILPAQAALSEILPDESRKVLAVKVDQVTALVTEILGFKAEQFTQVVVLPQGEFRKFLVTESQDRKTILETIFRTSFYSRLEKILEANAKKLQTEYEEAKGKQNLWLVQLELEKVEDVAPRLKLLREQQEQEQVKVKAGEEKRTRAQQLVSAAQILEAKFEEQVEASEELTRMQARQAEVATQRQDVAAAEAALLLQEQYQAALTAYRSLADSKKKTAAAAAEVQTAEDALKDCRARLQGSLLSLDLGAATPEAVAAKLNQALDALQEEVGKLAGVNVTLKELASQLVEGEPCPVCGSREHPRPATQVADAHATLQKEIAAKKAQAKNLRVLQTHLLEAEKNLSGAQRTRDALQQNLTEQEKANTQASVKFKEALAVSKFLDQKEFLQAAQKIVNLDRLRSAVEHFEKTLAIAVERKKRADTAVENLQRPDLLKVRAEFAEISTAYDAAVQKAAIQAEKVALFVKAGQELKVLNTRMQELSERYQLVAALSETARGNNASRISLSAFVLQTILDDVLLAANARLDTMTQGRYALKRSMILGDARKKSGLNIEVTDAYTGVARPVKTLSGGEIFLASLALALGLTDVVQAYAGGLRLDTILVDEGFGTLDPEALDAAIAALTELQSSGRLVGVISHVAELEERIPTRLEIIPGERGSVAKWHV